MYPDKFAPEEQEEATKRYLRIQRATEILTDDTMRANWEEFGDPEPAWWHTQFPSWIMNPGKTFIVIYVSFGLLLMILPFTILILIPGLHDPPSVCLRNIIEAYSLTIIASCIVGKRKNLFLCE
jgi:hypothetical protein